MYLASITSQPLSPFFFFNDTATTEIYTLSLHDALPIYRGRSHPAHRWAYEQAWSKYGWREGWALMTPELELDHTDRKSTRLNSSHGYISYAVFCLKKKKTEKQITVLFV